MRLWTGRIALGVVAALLGSWLVASFCSVDPVAAEPLPSGLEHVPKEGFGLATFDVAKLHDAKALEPLKKALTAGNAEAAKRVEADWGLSLAELDRATIYFPSATASASGTTANPFAPYSPTAVPSTLVYITAKKAFDKPKLFKAWKAVASTDPDGIQHGPVGQFGFGGGFNGFPPNAGGNFGFAGDFGEPKPTTPKAPAKEKTLDLEAPFYYGGQNHEYVMIPIDEKTLAIATGGVATDTNLVVTLLRKKKTGPLAEAIELGSKHAIVACIDGKNLKGMVESIRSIRAINDGGGGIIIDDLRDDVRPVQQPADPNKKVEDEFTPYEGLFSAERLLLTVDVTDGFTATVKATFKKADDAAKATPTFKGSFQDLADGFKAQRDEMAELPEDKVLLPLYDAAIAAVKGVKHEQDGTVLKATISLKFEAVAEAALAALPAKVIEISDRSATFNRLVQVAQAFQNVTNNSNAMPKDIVDETGKALLSWRVQLLPFLGPKGSELFEKIDRTKPWDDPANKKFWDDMPEEFRILGRDTKEKHETFIQAPHSLNWVGNNDPWQVLNKVITFQEVTDGTSNTIMAYEAETATNWMKPGDTPFDDKKLPAVGNAKSGKASLIMLDTQVRTIERKKLTGETLKALLTINGGEQVDLDAKP